MTNPKPFTPRIARPLYPAVVPCFLCGSAAAHLTPCTTVRRAYAVPPMAPAFLSELNEALTGEPFPVPYLPKR